MRIHAIVSSALLYSTLTGSVAWADGAFVIETISAWDGVSRTGDFGEPNTATYGQTFTAPSKPILTSVTFFLDDFIADPDVVDFALYVMAWDPIDSHPTGDILFQTGELSTTNNHGNGGFERFTVDTGDLVLDPFEKYVAFISASQFFDGVPGRAFIALPLIDAYGLGDFYFLNNGSNFNSLFTTEWEAFGLGLDWTFEMTFIPSPATAVVLLAGMAAGRRRRQ